MWLETNVRIQDEKADKLNPSAISYGFNVTHIGEAKPNDAVLCNFDIQYNVYEESAYIDGCDVD